jgi:F-type H+-transporting ATPase subunit alpha
MMELLKQGRYASMDVADQVLALFAGREGYLDDLDVAMVIPFREELVAFMQKYHDDVRREVRKGRITDELADRIKNYLDQFKKQFLEEHHIGEDDEEESVTAESIRAAENSDEASQAATAAAQAK